MKNWDVVNQNVDAGAVHEGARRQPVHGISAADDASQEQSTHVNAETAKLSLKSRYTCHVNSSVSANTVRQTTSNTIRDAQLTTRQTTKSGTVQVTH